jgi:hypothetical protein
MVGRFINVARLPTKAASELLQATPPVHPRLMNAGSVFANRRKPKIQSGSFTAIDADTGKIE